MIEASWPGQPFLDRTIDKGDVLLVSGNVRFFHGRQLQPREFINLGDEENGTTQGRVLSVYPATEGLSFKIIRSIIDAHLDPLLALVDEYLPAVAAAAVHANLDDAPAAHDHAVAQVQALAVVHRHLRLRQPVKEASIGA